MCIRDSFRTDKRNGKETWICYHNVESKHKSKQSHHSTSPKAQQIMATVFWVKKCSSDGFYWAPWSAVTADVYCTALLKVRHATLNWQHGILAAEMFPFTTTHTHMPTVRMYTVQTIHGKFRQEFFNYFSYSPALYLWLLHHTSPQEIARILMVQGE